MNHIHHKLLISASVEQVFQAITTADGLSGWWTPGATALPEAGTIARFPFGDTYYKEMKITEIIPSHLVQWHCVKGEEQWIGTNLSFRLEALGPVIAANSAPEVSGQVEQLSSDSGTVLTFHHNDWKAYTAMFAECNYTWGQFLRSLKLFCETGLGNPWPNQHRVTP